MKKINIVTLGCSKNVVDSERIMAQLNAAGWQVCADSNKSRAHAVIINTCGFIGDAKEESINMILECAAAKKRGEIEKLYVIGCLSERYRNELKDELPEVDSFFGARNIEEIVRELGSSWQGEINEERILTTPSHYAYLKISEGCDRNCGFCAIPLIRGNHRSVPMEDLIREAELLSAKGVKELIVIAQDTTYYGIDLYGQRMLAELLQRLCRIDGIEWIRLHYAYPSGFPDDVIETIAVEPKICKYLDIPLQHISDSQLKSMKRGIDGKTTLELIQKLRARIPGIALRTTLLVGYPGETDENFDELVDFVGQTKFERLGVFAYSAEEGTYSGENLPDDVPEEIKQSRLETIMEIQNSISLENNTFKKGKREKVIVDGRQGDYFLARTQYDSPEVDQEVLIEAVKINGSLRSGDFIMVEITGAEDYDLYAQPC